MELVTAVGEQGCRGIQVLMIQWCKSSKQTESIGCVVLIICISDGLYGRGNPECFHQGANLTGLEVFLNSSRTKNVYLCEMAWVGPSAV